MYFKSSLLISLVLFLSAGDLHAKRKRKTVGDVLKKIESIKVKKKKNLLPDSKKYLKTKTRVNLRSVKPPSSNRFYYDEGTSEQELEKITDEQIKHLYGMTQKFKKSSRRGELWVRLAELYVDKAKLIELRLQTDYDNALAAHQSGKRKRRPRLNLKPAEQYNKKSIQLYEWFIRDFPKDPKIDQALFFLGYNYFEIGKVEKGRAKYTQLTKRFPKSPYVDESNFALGEYYFEREKWKPAKKHYDKIARNRRSRLYSFALYKGAWCKYKTGKTKSALKDLERVILEGRKAKSGDRGNKKVSRIRLASEAVKDIVVFYPEVYKVQQARGYLNRVVGSKSAPKLIEKLAYYYVDRGDKFSAKYLFKELIQESPFSTRAYEYQHQIVKMYSAAGNQKVFRKELFTWIDNYGPGSVWRRENKKNKELMASSDKLIESTLRNYILQLHQTAQNSRAKYTQNLTKDGYEMYFSSIKKSEHLDQMNFFYGELLFDMKDYVGAAKNYNKVVARGNKAGKYYEQSILNSVLASEKKIPTASEVKTLVADNKEPVEFTSNLKIFEKAAIKYVKEYPKGENVSAIKYRLGSLYYYFNQYNKALPVLTNIVENHPKEKDAEYSANLILDIYNKKKDFEGLEKVADKLLAIPGLKGSNMAAKIADVKQKSSFKRAEKAAASGGNPLKAALSYVSFIKSNPKSDLLNVSRFNAALNYEKAGETSEALKYYRQVLVAKSSGSKDAELKKKSRRFLAFLYQKTGQYAKAAAAFEAYSKKYPKDKESLNYNYNAAVIYDGLNFYTSSVRNYEKYRKGSKKADRNEVYFTIAKMWDRRKKYPSKAIFFYNKYLNSGSANKQKTMEATYRIAKLHDSLNRKTLSKTWYNKVIARQRKLGVGVSFAAEAKFKLVERDDFKKFRSVRIPASQARMAGAVQKKLGLLDRLKEKLKQVVAYNDAYQIVAALTLQGESLLHMSNAIYGAPVPKTLKGEQLVQYKKGIDNLAGPFKKQAIESLKAAINKAYELQAYDDSVKKAASLLDKVEGNTLTGDLQVMQSFWLSKAGL